MRGFRWFGGTDRSWGRRRGPSARRPATSGAEGASSAAGDATPTALPRAAFAPHAIAFNARAGARRVKGLLALALGCVPGALWLSSLVWTAGAHPADAWLRDPVARGVAAACTAALGPAFVGAMWVFGRVYIAELHATRGEPLARIRTLIGRQAVEVPTDRVIAALRDAPRGLVPGRAQAPWAALHVPDARLPRVIDLGGEFSTPPKQWADAAAIAQSKTAAVETSAPSNASQVRRGSTRGRAGTTPR